MTLGNGDPRGLSIMALLHLTLDTYFFFTLRDSYPSGHSALRISIG